MAYTYSSDVIARRPAGLGHRPAGHAGHCHGGLCQSVAFASCVVRVPAVGSLSLWLVQHWST